MSHTERIIAELRVKIGTEIGLSNWHTVTQEQINQFAEATGDHQWIHVDVERAGQGPFRSTIAHGYLTLSLLPMFNFDLNLFPGVRQVLNYGGDKLRFLTPVLSGSRVRNRVELLEVTPKGEGRILLKLRNTVEIEGEEKPAMIAETLSLSFV